MKNQRIQYFFRMLGYTDESEQLGGWNIDNHHLNINGKKFRFKIKAFVKYRGILRDKRMTLDLFKSPIML